MIRLFGIPNCDTVKKARTWLDKKKITYEFVDFKKYRPTTEDLARWSDAFGSLPVNKAGTTFKKHKDIFESLSDKDKITFVQDNPSMIKRPVLEKNSKVLAFGFKEETYESII